MSSAYKEGFFLLVQNTDESTMYNIKILFIVDYNVTIKSVAKKGGKIV